MEGEWKFDYPLHLLLFSSGLLLKAMITSRNRTCAAQTKPLVLIPRLCHGFL